VRDAESNTIAAGDSVQFVWIVALSPDKRRVTGSSTTAHEHRSETGDLLCEGSAGLRSRLSLAPDRPGCKADRRQFHDLRSDLLLP
jgi:hypothetical protein